MLRITECFWNENNIEAIGKHKVTPDDVEEILIGIEGESPSYRVRRDGDYYVIYGETGGGRLLNIVGELLVGHRFRAFHANDMNDNERRTYRRG